MAITLSNYREEQRGRTQPWDILMHSPSSHPAGVNERRAMAVSCSGLAFSINRLEEPVTVLESRFMAVDEDLAERMRAILGRTGVVREVRMFGGLCFVLNNNLLAGTSKRSLLVRVGKDQHSRRQTGAARRKTHGNGRTVDGGLYFRRSGPA